MAEAETSWKWVTQRQISRRRTLAASGAAIAAAALAACGGGTKESTSGTGAGSAPSSSGSGAASTAASPTAKLLDWQQVPPDIAKNWKDSDIRRGGRFIYSVNQPPPHFDPALISAGGMLAATTPVYNRLIGHKVGSESTSLKFELTPDLAKSWETPDPLTYTFKMQDGVKWQNLAPVNGRAFEAEDVKLTYERYSNTPVQRQLFEAVESIQTPDKNTVVIKMKEPAVYFLYNLVGTSVHITAHEVWERDGDLRTTMVGTGPFQLKENKPNDNLLYTRNPDYWKKGLDGKALPYMDEYQLLIQTDITARRTSFRTKQVDHPYQPGEWEDLKGLRDALPGMQIQRVDTPWSVYGFSMPLDRAPFNDVRFRRAISMSIPRDDIGGTLYNDIVQQTIQIPWTVVGLKETPKLSDLGQYYQLNIAEAKKLLSAAGITTPYKLPYTISTFHGPAGKALTEVIQQSMKQAGIELQISEVDYTTFVDKLYGRKYDAPFYGWVFPYGIDLDWWTHGFMHSKSGRNYWFINDPDLDKLLEAQRRETDNNKRLALGKQIWDRELDQVYRPAYPGQPAFYANQSWVRNLNENAYAAPFHQGGQQVEHIWVTSDSPRATV